jgi:hypothetical protein
VDSLRGPKRLIVGADGFVVSAPQALREFAFTGGESSIALSRAPSRVVDRDWIVITGQAGHRQVRLGITRDNLPEVWQALAGTGVSLVPAADELERLGNPAYGVGRLTGWRRVAVTAVAVALLPFIPAIVLFVAHHLR